MFSGISGDSNAAYFCSVLHHLVLPEKLKQTGSHFMLSITRKARMYVNDGTEDREGI